MENAVHSWTFVQQFWCTTHKNKKIDFYPNFSTSFSFVFAEIKIINFSPDLDAFTAKAIYLCVGGGQGRSFFLIICYACSLWIKKNLFLKKIAHFNDRNNNFFWWKAKNDKNCGCEIWKSSKKNIFGFYKLMVFHFFHVL